MELSTAIGLACTLQCLTWAALDFDGTPQSQGDVVVFKGDGQLQQSQTAHLFEVSRREISDVRDTKCIWHDHKVLQVERDQINTCLGQD